jgi:hypothetical protein
MQVQVPAGGGDSSFLGSVLSACQKARTYRREGLVGHLLAHLESMKNKQTCPAYPEYCQKSIPMASQEMYRHLELVDCVPIPMRKSRTEKLTTSIRDEMEADVADHDQETNDGDELEANSTNVLPASSSASTILEKEAKNEGRVLKWRKALELVSRNKAVRVEKSQKK